VDEDEMKIAAMKLRRGNANHRSIPKKKNNRTYPKNWRTNYLPTTTNAAKWPN